MKASNESKTFDLCYTKVTSSQDWNYDKQAYEIIFLP